MKTRDYFILNFSPSAPRGIYLRGAIRTLEYGTRVLITPPPEVQALLDARKGNRRIRFLIKRIVGLPGDLICGTHGKFVLKKDDAIRNDASCKPIAKGYVFVEGEGARSYDSRVFGLIHETTVKGEGKLLIAF